MPSRNILRSDVANAYYHVYARGGSKQPIFLDSQDKDKFMQILQRYLGADVEVSKSGEVYPNFHNEAVLQAYCLMDNHFHLFAQQVRQGALSEFMRCLMTSYVRYFNLRHKRSGALFESRYKASIIYDDSYYSHISRYIHLNPKSWKYYPYSSIGYYRKGGAPDWLNTRVVLQTFRDRQDYMDFLYDYEDYKQMLDEIKHDLADI